jgi:hypothetical protein
MVFGRLWHVAEDPGGGEREKSTKFCVFLRKVVTNLWYFFNYGTLLKTLLEANAKIFMVFVRLGHVAEDPVGGERENLYGVWSSRTRC